MALVESHHTQMTPYEIWKGKKPKVGYFHVFGSMCYIINDREHLGKFDSKSDQGVFLGYSNNGRAYRVYNIRTQTVIEYANVVVDYHSDFYKFSKEEVINSFTDETVVDYVLDKQVEKPVVSIVTKTRSRQNTGRKFVAIETNNQSIMTDKLPKQTTSEKSGSLDFLDEEIG